MFGDIKTSNIKFRSKKFGFKGFRNILNIFSIWQIDLYCIYKNYKYNKGKAIRLVGRVFGRCKKDKFLLKF
jgi:hypothetical protein